MTPAQLEGRWRLLVEEEPGEMGDILTLRRGQVLRERSADPLGTYVAADETLTINLPSEGDNYEEHILIWLPEPISEPGQGALGIVPAPDLRELRGLIRAIWRADLFGEDEEMAQDCRLVRAPE